MQLINIITLNFSYYIINIGSYEQTRNVFIFSKIDDQNLPNSSHGYDLETEIPAVRANDGMCSAV